MPRRKDDDRPGLLRHLMGRGVDRRHIFLDADDYELYLKLLGMTVETYGWRLLAFCLMPNHVHLLVETTRKNLPFAMKFLHGEYATAFNRRHDRRGHRFEGPYRAPAPVESDTKFLQLVGYIAVNPVAAFLVDDAADWPWSSHAMVARGEAPDWLDHGYLLERIATSVGFEDYAGLVATHQRHALTDRARQTRAA